ncbi:PHD finger protein 14-like, partial [Tropilaelaps mercedesae]
VEGDEDGDNSDPGSEAGPDEDETAEENLTDTDSSENASDGNVSEDGGDRVLGSGKHKDKKEKKRDKEGKQIHNIKENGQPQTAIEKAKLIAEKAFELNCVAGGIIKILVCNICLGDRSAESDEIVECDSCGVTVHEGCYGVSDSDSVLSTGSSASTEPWFCDSCKAGVLAPNCELCPNPGGIFKETDAGRWVHLVCALYTPGCAFGSVEKLTPVTLFEMQYSKWGQRACHLCEDAMMARTGVTISCDAGMCRISFHVTCAQRMGLLSDANPEYIADPFYAHCKVHVDKSKMKAKKKNWSILQHQARIRKEKEQREETERQELSKEKERVLRKLTWLRDRYANNKASKPKPWIPTQKMPRLLHSSSTAIEKFRRKAELYGLSHILIAPPEDKRWHGQPAFSADFVAYFLDRQRRFIELERSLEKNIDENTALRKQQALMNQLYEKVAAACKKEREDSRYIAAKLDALWCPLKEIAGLRCEPRILEEKRQRDKEKENGNSIGNGDEKLDKREDGSTHAGSVSPQKILKTYRMFHFCCTFFVQVCGSSDEPHQQLECEQCRNWFHLFCLQPPLTRFPKKSKGVNWLCEDCLEANRVQAESANTLVLSTSRRSRGQSSRLARETNIDVAGEETGSRSVRGRPTGKKRGRKPGSKNKDKAVKEKEAAPAPAAVVAGGYNGKDKEMPVKTKGPADEEPIVIKDNNEALKEKDAVIKNKDREISSTKESDADTEDDLNNLGLDEEEDEPSPEKKQPARGVRKKRKTPAIKGSGGKRKRISTKDKETPKEEGEQDADGEHDEDMDIDNVKEEDDATKLTKKDKNDHGLGKEVSISKRERDNVGGRDKQHQYADHADENKKKEDKKSPPIKEVDKTDEKTVCKVGEYEKDASVQESFGSSGCGNGGRALAGKNSSANKDCKEGRETFIKDAEAKPAGASRKERESTVIIGDGRKHCVKCEHTENTNQIVICDECGSGVHWACLDPPSKKNPKPRGYTWNCDECEAKLETLESNATDNTTQAINCKEKAKTSSSKQEIEITTSASTETK